MKRTVAENAAQFARNHRTAYSFPRKGFEGAFSYGIRALAEYADAHQERYDSPLAEDYVLGEAWEQAIRGVLALLNGELGRLDGGELDRTIREIGARAGFKSDKW